MSRFLVVVLILVSAAIGLHPFGPSIRAQEPGGVYWIWFPEGDPIHDAPAGSRYFRKVFTVNRPAQTPTEEAGLDIAADDAFTVWLNGSLVGSKTVSGTSTNFLHDGVNLVQELTERRHTNRQPAHGARR